MPIGLQCFPSNATQAKRLAGRLDIALQEIEIHHFPDGELRLTVGRPEPTTIVYAALDQPNEKLIALLLAAEALRRNGADRIVLVAPYLCYMRQDAAFEPLQAISQRVMGRLIAETFDRVVTIDAHLHRTTALENVFPGIQADNLSAMRAIADALQGIDPTTVVVGPDAESGPWISTLAARLGLAHAVATKRRAGDRSVTVSLPNDAQIAGRPILLVDDIVSSGATLIACTRALIDAGATTIDAVVTHALFSGAMIDLLKRTGLRSIRSTDSVPHPTNAIALDKVLADALANEGLSPVETKR